MNFHGNLRAQLLKEVTADTQNYNAMINDPLVTESDQSYFIEEHMKRRQSTLAYNEQIRANHTMLKAAIESMP